jgi:hypothetical protein
MSEIKERMRAAMRIAMVYIEAEFAQQRAVRLAHCDRENLIEHCAEIIAEQVPLSPTPGWISVEERLPEEGELVIACDLCPDTQQRRIALLTWTKYWTGPNDQHVMRWDDQSGDSYQDYVNVTHWQALPAPPTEEK